MPFDGVAIEPLGRERPVTGTDYVTVGADGVQQLEIRARIGTGRDVVSYRAIGRGTDATGPQELLVFETANSRCRSSTRRSAWHSVTSRATS